MDPQVSYESRLAEIAHAPAGSRPKKQRDRPALYDTTFAPTTELESQRCVTASSSLHTRPAHHTTEGPRTCTASPGRATKRFLLPLPPLLRLATSDTR